MSATTVGMRNHSKGQEEDGYSMEYPDSVEEAAALLGATITRCCGVNGRNIHEAVLPPLGMHPAFAVVVNHNQNNNGGSSSSTMEGGTPESELIHRLYILRSMLRTAADTNVPLVAAPSILQVLKKLLGISTQIAAAVTTPVATTSVPTTISFSSSSTASSDATPAISIPGEVPKDQSLPKLRKIVLHHKYDTPPLWSTPCRILWVDCVVLCHALSSTTSSNDLTLFVRQMLALASIHPRSVKAGGGVRIAALSVIAALLEHDDVVSPERALESLTSRQFTLATKLAPWSLDILQVCLKALRSAGNGEPTFREAAIRTACATATACRNAAVKNRHSRSDRSNANRQEDFCLPGAMEDKAIAESIKILKQAVTDKFPEVRSGAATFAIILAPILISHHSPTSSGSTADPLLALEEVMQLALRNLDDESLVVADGWAEAMARCLCTGLQYSDTVKAAAQGNTRNGDGGGDGAESTGTSATAPSPTAATSRFGAKKFSGLTHTLTTHLKVINYLVEQFVKVGGEFVASKAGGMYSMGGRAVRLGWCMTLARFLRIQSAMSAIGESRSISMHTVILAILDMVKEQDIHTKGTPIARSTSVSDVTLCRLFALRVLRYGLTELASESIQVSILQELVAFLPTNENTSQISPKSQYTLKENQIHVVIVEVSNLIVALGEAAGSRIDELKVALDLCIVSANSGIRYEASILCVAIASKFPSYGIALVNDSLEVIQQQLALIVEAIPAGQGTSKERNPSTTVFGRSPKIGSVTSKASNESAILGRSLLISMLTKAMPNHADGFPRSAISDVLKVAEMLISSQFNELLTTSSPSNVCSLVRAGFAILSGVLTTGPDAVEAHMSEIVSAWKKAGNAAINGGKNMSPAQDLLCVESALSSVTVFLKYCSELLLIIPEALSQVSMLLEDIFPLLQANGRLANTSNDPDARILVENATATLFEAFAWLPSGSFPLVADEVFSFAEEQIQKSVEEGVVCSILDSLIAKQDNMLDSKPFCRTGKDSKLFGSRDFEDSANLVSGDIAMCSERESVYHLQSDIPAQPISEREAPFCGSAILDYFVNDNDTDNKPPTPLHEVGTWRRPVDPSCSSRVRLVDAAIQAFSATFGLKDGKEQQGAMNLLELLLPQSLCHFARTIGISPTSTEPEKRSKLKDDSAAAFNITAVLLSCLQALPLHEATHNIPIGLGPPWMNKAKVLLLTLLPSASTNVRRASAEGLALLATLGVTEDAHFLQSALLHSLDEIMQSNKPDGKARTLASDQVSAARAGSLLTLACIQRTASNVAKRKLAKARGRLYGNKSDQSIDKSNENLPVLQMMTRILPSAACHGFKEHFIVKTHALYSFTVLLMYSTRLSSSMIGEDDKQLLRKGIELVEENFSSSWTAASSDLDRGNEADRLDCEIAFVAVLLRLMTFLLPFLHQVKSEDSAIARRFSVFATLAVENLGSHPSISVEAMAFFEVSCMYRNLFPKRSRKLRYTENAIVSCLPSIFEVLFPARLDVFGSNVCKSGQIVSFRKSLKAAVFLLRLLPLRNESGEPWSPMMLSSILISTLEVVSGSRRNELASHTVSTNRQIKYNTDDDTSLEGDIFVSLLNLLLRSDPASDTEKKKHLLRCVLLARQLVARFSSSDGTKNKRNETRENFVAEAISQAATDSSYLYNVTSAARWQVKCFCMQLATEALQQLRVAEVQVSSNGKSKTSQFDLLTATNLFEKYGKGVAKEELSSSRLVFHLEDILSAACMSSVATIDQAELRSLQVNSMYFVRSLVECFGQIHDPEEPSKCILYQYSSQIISSVKSALAAPGKKQSTQLSCLFIAGCEVLQYIIKNKLMADEGVVKRLLSMIMPHEESFPLFTYSDGFRAEFSYSATALVVRLTGAVSVGNILLSRRMILEEQFVENVTNEIVKDRLGIASYLAAAAVDGCRILTTQKLSLVGRSIGIDTAIPEDMLNSGFFYQNDDDLDDLIKSMLTSTWTQCSCSSLEVFVDELNSDGSDDACRELCVTWINSLVPLLLSGLQSGIYAIRSVTKQSTALKWHTNIDPTIVLNNSMYCVGRILSSTRPASSVDFFDDIDAVINLTCDAILSPIFHDIMELHPFDESAIDEACNLIKLYAQSNFFTSERNPTFLIFLLSSLKKSVNVTLPEHDNHVDEVIITCLLAISEMIARKQSLTHSTVVKAMMHHTMETLTSQNFVSREKVRDAAKVLLKTCLLDRSSTTPDDVEKVLCQFASNDLWEEWAMIAGLDAEVYPSLSSVQILQTLLRYANRHKSHAAALVGIRLLLQNWITTSPDQIGHFLYDIGADILNLLYTNGTMAMHSPVNEDMLLHRTAICADSMKIILLVYRHLSNAIDEESNMAAFLNLIFEVFLAVIRFNGLPNHPSPEKQYGDPGLGRICAQAILFVARTTPIPFKECVALLPNDHNERTLLEFAVRAEMNGYVVAASTVEPIKKKLNLKSFQK